MNKLARLCQTIRHLKLKQVYYRLYYRFFRVFVVVHAMKPLPKLSRQPWIKVWNAPLICSPAQIKEDIFCFLGCVGEVKTGEDWNADDKSKLWLYNLHYLNDLNAQGADKRKIQISSLITRWTDENPPLVGNGWEPYPISIRIVNLVKWYGRQNELPVEWLISLARMAQALEAQLEWHILANHIFANGKALTFVGAFYSDSFGNKLLELGLRILDREVPEQFLSDGGHFELSPMYHAILLWDLCDLVNLADRSNLPELKKRAKIWRPVIACGIEWLQSMCHPDGEISFFNDAAFGVAKEPRAIFEYAKKLGIKQSYRDHKQKISYKHLADTGYIIVEYNIGVKALLDVADIGPLYQPGHAHADTLSFELSIFGKRVLVNSGTSVYEEGKEREKQRGTFAHNTVTINRKNSSEVWGSFRVAKRARPIDLKINSNEEKLTISCEHDGYRSLLRSPRHLRKWIFSSGCIKVVDRIFGTFSDAVARFHIHPDIQLGSENEFYLGTGQKIEWNVLGGEAKIVPSFWNPKFGKKIDNYCIEVTFNEPTLKTTFNWNEKS